MNYLVEIKNRFNLVVINYVSTLLVCYYYKEVLLFLIIKSYNNFNNTSFYFIFTGITEIFSVYLDVIFFFSFQVLIFYIIYSFFIFLIPALFFSEYKYLKFLIYFLSVVTVCLVWLSIKVLIPFIWDFFVSFQTFSVGQSFYFEAKLPEYFNFYVSTYNSCLLLGQFFSLFFIFLNDIFSKIKFIKKYRKLYYYFFIFFATMISPPEIYSQIVISLILIMFYELAILFLMVSCCVKNQLTR